ncbi:MAG: pyridoxamine 5'-phosphate oxidase family protein [Ilumatobacteraceae bacterium]
MPKLTPEEMESLLTKFGMVRIATIDEDGAPLVVPLGFVYHEGQIMMTARERVSWLENIRRDPRVCLTIDDQRYPLPKITVRGVARILFEPGQDDAWRDLRLPLPDPDGPGPVGQDDQGRDLYRYDEAYRQMTHDEPRALVAVSLDESTVTSWRMPIAGEPLGSTWASRYYRGEPRQYRVSTVGRGLRDVLVVDEQS